MWAVLVRFLVCCHILPERLLTLVISSPSIPQDRSSPFYTEMPSPSSFEVDDLAARHDIPDTFGQ